MNLPNIGDTSWIKPQKMVGVWWEMHVGKSSWDYSGGQVGSQQSTKVPHGANTANVKRYIDFAAKHGIYRMYWWKDGIQVGKTGLVNGKKMFLIL